jgi:hypothetical protein
MQSVFNSTGDISNMAYAIQLALAPVFLLTGIAGILNVITGRLSRIIDRGRFLTENRPEQAENNAVQAEMHSLDKRRYLASSAITACTFSALLVCMVVAALFVEVLLELHLKWLVGLLFTGSTVTLVIGLSQFLREVHLATKTVRFTTVANHLK